MSAGDIIATVTLVVVVIAAWNGYKQLRDAKNIARGQFILAIDHSLARFEELRHQINSRDLSVKRGVNTELRRYFAALERIGPLLQNESLDLTSVKACYGGRLEKLINSTDPDYAVRILTATLADKQGWDDFLWLWKELRDPLGLRGVPHEIQVTREASPVPTRRRRFGRIL